MDADVPPPPPTASTVTPVATPLPTPPPPPPAPGPGANSTRSVASATEPTSDDVGRLTPGWRTVVAITWGLMFLAMLGVWKTSRELGLNTWWLGPLGDPRPVFVSILPLAAPTAAVIAVANNLHRATWVQFGAAAVLAAIALGDVNYVFRLAMVEFAIAAAGALVATASLAGRYRTAS